MTYPLSDTRIGHLRLKAQHFEGLFLRLIYTNDSFEGVRFSQLVLPEETAFRKFFDIFTCRYTELLARLNYRVKMAGSTKTMIVGMVFIVHHLDLALVFLT